MLVFCKAVKILGLKYLQEQKEKKYMLKNVILFLMANSLEQVEPLK